MTTPRYPDGSERLVLTDSGLETTLIFEMGFDLPEFASFPLLETEDGRTALRTYYRRHVEVAVNHGTDVVLDTPTWRASSGWGAVLGYDTEALAALNTAAVALVREVAETFSTSSTEVLASGCIGPRGDGYDATTQMTPSEAEAFHRPQIEAFRTAGADVVTALTMTHVGEAIGIARAAATAGVPAVISFTVETDGRLPSGQALGEAIEAVDAATDGSVAAFGINCAHPDHFAATLADGGTWIERIGLIRANASRMSHAELDEAEELDAGDPVELAGQYAELRRVLPALEVVGGCCGTDHTHVDQIARACLAPGGRAH